MTRSPIHHPDCLKTSPPEAAATMSRAWKTTWRRHFDAWARRGCSVDDDSEIAATLRRAIDATRREDRAEAMALLGEPPTDDDLAAIPLAATIAPFPVWRPQGASAASNASSVASNVVTGNADPAPYIDALLRATTRDAVISVLNGLFQATDMGRMRLRAFHKEESLQAALWTLLEQKTARAGWIDLRRCLWTYEWNERTSWIDRAAVLYDSWIRYIERRPCRMPRAPMAYLSETIPRLNAGPGAGDDSWIPRLQAKPETREIVLNPVGGAKVRE